MYLACRRDLSTPFCVFFLGALQAERSLSVSRLKGRTTLAGWRGTLCLVTYLDFILILVENSPLVLCQFLPLTEVPTDLNADFVGVLESGCQVTRRIFLVAFILPD